jgi:predicted Zn-dependent protease
VQVARKDFGGSIATYKRAFEQAPADTHAMYSLVRSYVLADKSREAITFLNSVVAASPRNQMARVLQAQLLAQEGKVGAARETLQAAIHNDPKDPVPYQVLVNVLMAAREENEASAVVERGLQAVPTDFGLRLSRAVLLHHHGKTDEAIAVYESLLAERPNAVIAANNLAALLADHRKDADSLRRAYDIALRFRQSDIPHLKDTAGWTAHLSGKHREAADLLKSASTDAPDLAVAHYHYGMNQLALNNTKAAKAALQRSIELAKTSPFPQVDEARRTLEKL